MVDFGSDAVGALPPNGFLHSLSSLAPRGEKYQELIAALSIGAWRIGDVRQADAPLQIGARTTVLLYDSWRDRLPRSEAMRWPYDDFAAFEGWLRPLVRANRRLPIVWEVWNEWDLGLPWWGGTEAQLFETYALAERIVREEVGELGVVAGPSFARFDTARFRRFADYCVRAGCQVNAWTWHEIAQGHSGDIATRVRWVRDSIASNPKYRALQVRSLDVNEVMSRSERYSSGSLVTALRGLYDGGADAFARSCWQEFRSREYECSNASLDGIVDATHDAPRVGWWVHAAYARIREAPVESHGGERAVALAGRGHRASDAALVLVANTVAAVPSDSIVIELRRLDMSAPRAGRAEHRRIVVRRLPWKSLDLPLDSLPLEAEYLVAFDAPLVRLRLPALATERISTNPADVLVGRDAYLVSIEPVVPFRSKSWPVGLRSGSRP